MPKLHVFVKFWLLVLLWMVVIFSASSDAHSYEHSSYLLEPILHWLFPGMSQPNIGKLHHFLRKCGHLAEYAVLALLVWRAIHATNYRLPAWSWPKVGGTLLVVFLFAATDEFHQEFVPTRTPTVRDVFIDTAGGAVGLLILWFVHRYRNRRNAV